ncbi:hypothetical protein M413DRAFT_312999 [Hebeloma cylindrosporum]|uniref:SWR1-complex protein 4 n=1 Tax=Hebeloma cylindrosporum TaxID=76867 RepID=A0A0C2Y960_HEBCY|nr:hypothetical protein M413DRAFT_312999 [Hebeloma cylindrosporum h7]
MAASAADIRSALSIPEASATAGPSQPKKPALTNTRKPEGISRELYSLIGPSAPSLAAQLIKPRLKQKPNFGGGTSKTRWELRPFKNSGRRDNLELQHWEKVTTDPATEYSFAKYNVQPTTYSYSQDEYTRFLEDKDWTKEETDYLFSVVQDFDLRWYIISDRYDYPDGPSRHMDDLKDRYYSVCRKLVRNRPWAGDELSKSQLMASFQFDKERELMRKKYILSLENRTPDQIAEEEALYVEVKRLEHTERKFKRDRENLLRTLAGIDSGLPDIVEDDGSILGLSSESPSNIGSNKKKSQRKSGLAMDADSPATPSVASTPVIKRPQNLKNAAYDAQHCIIRTDVPASGIATKAAHQPAYLRTFKIPVMKTAVQQKVQEAVAELGLSSSRLVMPTRENVAQLDAMLEAMLALLETKRLVEKAEYDIQVLKKRLGLREQSTADGEGSILGIEGGESTHVDYAPKGGDIVDETPGENGRSQSVLSVRSARSRKHPRRSLSISSVDTVSTRAGTKRQKRS